MDGFKICFLLIVAGSFVVMLTEKYPLSNVIIRVDIKKEFRLLYENARKCLMAF